MCGETTEADSAHADISSIFTSGKNREGKMFQTSQTNDLLNAPCLADVNIQVFSGNSLQ